MKVLGCVLTLVLALGIIIGIDALIALFIDWLSIASLRFILRI
jgi:hypothetical protein